MKKIIWLSFVLAPLLVLGMFLPLCAQYTVTSFIISKKKNSDNNEESNDKWRILLKKINKDNVFSGITSLLPEKDLVNNARKEIVKEIPAAKEKDLDVVLFRKDTQDHRAVIIFCAPELLAGDKEIFVWSLVRKLKNKNEVDPACSSLFGKISEDVYTYLFDKKENLIDRAIGRANFNKFFSYCEAHGLDKNAEKIADFFVSSSVKISTNFINNYICDLPDYKRNHLNEGAFRRLGVIWLPSLVNAYPSSYKIIHEACKVARKEHPWWNLFFNMGPIASIAFLVIAPTLACTLPLVAACWYFKFNPLTAVPLWKNTTVSAVKNWNKVEPGFKRGGLEMLYFGYKGLAPYGAMAKNFVLDKRTIGGVSTLGVMSSLAMTYLLRKPLKKTLGVVSEFVDAQVCDMPSWLLPKA